METFKVGEFVKLTGPDWNDRNLSPDKPYRVLSVPEEDNGWAVVQDGWMVDPTPGQPFSGEVVPEWVEASEDFGTLVQEVVNEVRDTLIAKNKAYGNSALEPVRVFSTADPVEQLRVRIDDKLSRLKSSLNDDNEDTVLDLMGYLVLLRIATRKQGENG